MEGGLVMGKIYFNFSEGSLKRAMNSSLFIQTYRDSLIYILNKEDITEYHTFNVLNRAHNLFREINTINCDFFERLNIASIKITPTIFSYIQRQFSKIGKNIKISFINRDIQIRYRLTPGDDIHTKATFTPIIKEALEVNQGPEITDIFLCRKLLHLKENADKRNIPFELSFKRLKMLWRLPKCQLTGEYYNYIKDDPQNPDWKSIDRWDNEKGYTDDNCISCKQGLNNKKGDLTIKELEALFKFHQKKLKK